MLRRASTNKLILAGAAALALAVPAVAQDMAVDANGNVYVMTDAQKTVYAGWPATQQTIYTAWPNDYQTAYWTWLVSWYSSTRIYLKRCWYC